MWVAKVLSDLDLNQMKSEVQKMNMHFDYEGFIDCDHVTGKPMSNPLENLAMGSPWGKPLEAFGNSIGKLLNLM